MALVMWCASDVGHDRTKHVERRLVAPLLFEPHVPLDLVHRHVARPFDHHLAVALSRTAAQFAHHLQLGELGFVAGVGDRSRPQPVPQTPRHVVLAHDVAQVVEVGVKRVLLRASLHPFRHQRAAPADDAGQASLRQRQMLAEQPAVDRHIVTPCRLQFHHVGKSRGRIVGDVVELLPIW